MFTLIKNYLQQPGKEQQGRVKAEGNGENQKDNAINDRGNTISLIIGNDSNEVEEGRDSNDIQKV